MAPMILECAACLAQNFVSVERRAASDMSPRCWKCGEPLPPQDETGARAGESYNTGKRAGPTGENGNA